jgi:hypothetical protein
VKQYAWITAGFLMLFVGCFRQETTERQLSDTAFLKFPKLEFAIQVKLEGDSQRMFAVPPDASAKYEIPAGTWRVKVLRDGQLLMDRKVFISAGETREFDLK